MIIMSVGLPGIGKTTYLKNQFDGEKHWYLSGDMTRKEVTGEEDNFSQEGLVWELILDRFEEGINLRKNIILDATFISKKRRKPFLDVIRRTNVDPKPHLRLVIFPLDVTLSIKRQKGRERKVDQHVLKQFHSAYERVSADELQGINYDIVEVD